MNKEEKYLRENIELIRAVILGTVTGLLIFPSKESDVDRARYATDTAMSLIEKDVRRIYKYGKRIKP